MHWTAKVDGGPQRVNHAAIAYRDRIYSFGGYCSNEDYLQTRAIDVHVLNPNTLRWTRMAFPQIQQAGAVLPCPYQRYGHTVVEYRGRAYVWGGRNDGNGADNVLHACELPSMRWSRIKPTEAVIPPARDGHSACVIGDQMVIFGGFEEEFQRFSQECYAFDFRNHKWLEIRATGPLPAWRDFHTALGIDRKMYIFGGRSDVMGQFHSNRELYHETLQYLDMDSLEWNDAPVIGPRPTGRRSHSTWEYDGKMFIFGGFSGREGKHFNTVHSYDPATSSWTHHNVHGSEPTARRRQCTVRLGNRVYLFGGTCPQEVADRPITPDAADDNSGKSLFDLSDTHVLDFSPTLETLSMLKVVSTGMRDFGRKYLSKAINDKIDNSTLPNKISSPFAVRMVNSG